QGEGERKVLHVTAVHRDAGEVESCRRVYAGDRNLLVGLEVLPADGHLELRLLPRLGPTDRQHEARNGNDEQRIPPTTHRHTPPGMERTRSSNGARRHAGAPRRRRAPPSPLAWPGPYANRGRRRQTPHVLSPRGTTGSRRARRSRRAPAGTAVAPSFNF